jgi:hypothetical protein
MATPAVPARRLAAGTRREEDIVRPVLHAVLVRALAALFAVTALVTPTALLGTTVVGAQQLPSGQCWRVSRRSCGGGMGARSVIE